MGNCYFLLRIREFREGLILVCLSRRFIWSLLCIGRGEGSVEFVFDVKEFCGYRFGRFRILIFV